MRNQRSSRVSTPAPRSYRYRLGAVAAVAVLVCSLPVATTSPRDAQAAQTVPDSDAAPTAIEAAAIAHAHGHPVGIDDETGTQKLTEAMPDGSLRLTASSLPIRAKVSGAWTKLNTDLVRTKSGTIEPKVAAVRVRFSPGGDDVLARVQTESGAWVTTRWPLGPLPEPKVSGAMATYEGVLPGVDLTLTATPAGMTEVLIIHTAQAAADPRLGQLTIATDARGVTVDDAAHAVLVADDGSTLSSSAPMWWDSSEKGADTGGPGGDAPLRPIERTQDGESLGVDIAAALDGEKVTYPVYIDPDLNRAQNAFWYTDRAYPAQSYLNGNQADGVQRVGNGGGYLSHAFWQFDTSGLAGKVVMGARFNTTLVGSFSCTGRDIQAWRYGPLSPGFTWNNEQALWYDHMDTRNVGCTGGAVGFDAFGAATWASTTGSGSVQIALKARDDNDSLTRRHFAQGASLTVQYNSRPNTPANPAMTSPARDCATDPANPAYVNGSQAITLKVTVTDPDPQNTAASFSLTRTSTGTRTQYTTPVQAQGNNLTYSIPANSLIDGETYAWNAVGNDTIHLSVGSSPTCYFVLDSTKPGLPTIAPEPGTSPQVGTASRYVITPPPGDAIAGYQVWWTKGALTSPSPAAPVSNYTTALPPCVNGGVSAVRIVCAGPDGSVTIEAAPIDKQSTLWVAAYDKAGNVSYDASSRSAAGGLEVIAAAADLSNGHMWMADDMGATELTDTVGSVPIRIGGHAGWESTGTEDPPLKFMGMTSLNGYVKPGTGHITDYDAGYAPGYSHEIMFGLLARYGSGAEQPSGTNLLYSCAYGAGNMISRAANCDGAGPTGRPIGYSWTSAAAVPGGYTAVEIFRCRSGSDYFMKTSPDCGPGVVNEGTRGFVVKHEPTTTPAGTVDTTKSFTVSARVKASGQTEAQTIVSASGANYSGFYLQTGPVWQFCVRSQGATLMTGCASVPRASSTSEFVTLSGTWDAVNQQVRVAVYANKALSVSEAHFAHPADNTAATGAIVLGSAMTGIPTQFFAGSIADVALYPTALPESALRQIPVPQP